MATYKDAGVDIDAGDRAVELMKASVARASRPEVMGGIGGFCFLPIMGVASCPPVRVGPPCARRKLDTRLA